MKLLIRILLLMLWGVWGVADRIDPYRLSWSHRDFLKNGFSSIPWIRDPFFPSNKKFRISGIISGELAFINGRWVKEGDKLDGYVVRSVRQDEVALSKQGERIILRLRE